MKILPAELILPPRTILRSGAAEALIRDCALYGKRGMIVHGRSLERAGVLSRMLQACPSGVTVKAYAHAGGEPTLANIEDLLDAARKFSAEWLAGVGGGSVMDLAKAGAGLLNAPLPPVAYHDGAPIPAARVPFIAVPTTAGTGSEATIVCVITNPATGVKKSFRHPSFMARLVVLDPDLVLHAPPPVIAAAGMDAYTQALESHVSLHATGLTDALSLKAIALVAGSLEAVFSGREKARAEDLLTGSYLAGVALSNARLGVVHGLAHPLGARCKTPHGLTCAACLPFAIEFNRAAMGGKYAALGEAVGGDLLDVTRRLNRALDLRSPFAGQPVPERDQVVKETLDSGSTAANPRPVTAQDVNVLLDRIFAV